MDDATPPTRLRLKPRLSAVEPATDRVTPVAPPVASGKAMVAPSPAVPAAPGADLAGTFGPAHPPPAPPIPTEIPAAAAAPIDPPALTAAPGVTQIPTEPLDVRTRRVVLAAAVIGGLGCGLFAVIGTIAFPRLMAQQARHREVAARFERAVADQQDERDDPALIEPPETDPAPAPAAEASPAPATLPPPIHTTAPASSEFHTWVQNVKISGGRAGASPRVLIGPISYHRGDVVHPELGIVFHDYDPDRRMVSFRSSTGEVMERRDR